MKDKEIKVETVEPDFSSVAESDKKPVRKEITVTSEEQELIFKGIRPEGMDKEVFKVVRKKLENNLKLYQGGKFKHISGNIHPLLLGKIESAGTYKRSQPRRHELLGRKSHNGSKNLLDE